MKYLIFGKGYIGTKFLERLGEEAEYVKVDIANLGQVREVLSVKRPEVLINCAGVTGKPNIDWCEDHKSETLYANVAGPIVLAKACEEFGVRMVQIGSGCLYQGGFENGGYKETDEPDPKQIPSFYSWTKYWMEQNLKDLPVLILRLRMPLDGEASERNFIWKITHYERVINVPNTISIVSDFIEASIQLIEKGCTGVYNVVNPGAITHKEILDMYKEVVDPDFEYKLFSTEDMMKIVKAGRSNCVLNTEKIESEGIKIPHIKDRLPEVLMEYKMNLQKL